MVRRDGYRCTDCGVPNYVLTKPRHGKEPWIELDPFLQPAKGKVVRVILGVAHLDGDPRNRSEANLATKCPACHLQFDAPFHASNARETRLNNKDGARLLLQVGA